jgi:soluble lytic murein transglycosylase
MKHQLDWHFEDRGLAVLTLLGAILIGSVAAGWVAKPSFAAESLVKHRRQAQPQPQPEPELEKTPGIAVVMNHKLNGLSELDLSERVQLRADAAKYFRFKLSRGDSSERGMAEQKLWFQRCQERERPSVFCRPGELAESGIDREARLREKNGSAEQEWARAQELLKKGDLDLAQEISDSVLSRTFFRVSARQEFDVLKSAALAAKPCEAARVGALMAARFEEFLPDSQALKDTVALYERAAQCDEQNDWTERSRYRAALLLISRQDWARAIPHLDSLAQRKESDFYSRAIFWKARAEKARGNRLGFTQLAARLNKEFPIHYHSLLLAPRVLFNAAQNLHLPEPTVSFVCDRIGREWNARARAVEALQEMEAYDVARSFLSEMEDLMEGAEAQARLYLAILQHRNASTLGTFRVLSSLFREHPAMLSRQTLAIFFPLSKTLESFLNVARGGGLDPYLIAALIRQESGFVASARSRAGALGLMQLMPSTARSLEPVSKRELLDGRTNVRLGVKFFRRLLAQFDGKVDLALAAYNAGPSRVAEWRRRYPVADPVLFVDLIPIKETREYVSLISRNYYWYLQIYARHIFDERTQTLASVDRQLAVSGSKNSLEFSLFHSH